MFNNKNNIDLTKTSSYNYELPKNLIAQDPVKPRDSSRLLVVSRDGSKPFEHKIFKNITEYLFTGDLLVLNNTRVIPARVSGKKKFGGACIEILFLHPDRNNLNKSWIALVKPGKKLPPGTLVTLLDGTEILVGEKLEDGLRNIFFDKTDDPLSVIHKLGQMPLPHYITETHSNPEQYQTIYSNIEKENSVASPTAGLHFTEELLNKLLEKGIDKTFVTLQVGLGTFRPVKVENISKHIMHSELCEVSQNAADLIIKAKKDGRRVIAVGTTVARTLESFAKEFGSVTSGTLDTQLFISPGYEYKVIDGLITNFHLPKSTLLMLVSAFGGYDNIMSAYREAVNKGYRFFSFGDSMFIS
ncbi:MAG: tRNA preQ1(34) S-adenosylmethionine ribosyltransferase-isomerase QueA [Synergistaceae bacterium]|jgi:S-adenosylmethionine:tRNA ribosyltransferase-isomerase|nr:tRNA preQ1(34) S-adenosylmethionine ribosyltransferase-isomerase QueA [Synergistaceae bacterium]